MGEEKSERSQPSVCCRVTAPIGVAITSACGIAARPAASTGSRRRPPTQAQDDRHAVGRPADRLGADLRARRDDRPLLRVEVPHAAGRGAQGRPADPRQHAARGHLDRDPGDHPRRASAPTPTSSCTTSRRPRPTTMHVRVVGEQFTWTFYYPGAGRQGDRLAAALPARGQAGEVHSSSPRTSCTTSGSPPSGMKIDAVPGHHDHLPRHAESRPARTRSSAPSCAGSGTR